jgi:hypothetical protein
MTPYGHDRDPATFDGQFTPDQERPAQQSHLGLVVLIDAR